MRGLLPLLLVVLAGCAPGPWAALAGVELASVTVFGRGVVDMGVSAATGRDCSLVRLDRGQTYCAAEATAAAEAYCTRTLAAVDCWAVPRRGAGVGDTPVRTREQAEYQAARWPKALATMP